MKTRLIKIIILQLILMVGSLYAQINLLEIPHFTRTIRMGNAYTGVADGPETIFYNPAGLAYNDYFSFVYSKGLGDAIFADALNSNDYAIVLPLPKEFGTIGLSILSSYYKLNSIRNIYIVTTNTDRVYSLHYARELTKNIGVGASFNLLTFKIIHYDGMENYSATNFNFGISILFRIEENLITENDRLQAGLFLNNILDNKIEWNTGGESGSSQLFRYGFSYLYNPELFDIKFIKMLFAFDLVASAGSYTFTNWNPNFGLELTLVDVLHLSYGRENMDGIRSYGSLQYPVNRFGIGTDLKLNKIFKSFQDVVLKIDYCRSNWEKFDEENPPFFFGDGINDKIDRDSYSISLNVKF